MNYKIHVLLIESLHKSHPVLHWLWHGSLGLPGHLERLALAGMGRLAGVSLSVPENKEIHLIHLLGVVDEWVRVSNSSSGR